MKVIKSTYLKFYLFVLLFAVACVGHIQSKTISLDSLLRGPAMTEIVIKKVNNEEVKLFYIKPADNKPLKNRTAVVWIHGGGWTGGKTETFFPHARYTVLLVVRRSIKNQVPRVKFPLKLKLNWQKSFHHFIMFVKINQKRSLYTEQTTP